MSQGQQLLAGQKMTKIAPEAKPDGPKPGARDDLKVVMWHSREMRKLTVDESPRQSALVRFLKENPEIVVYTGENSPRSYVRIRRDHT